jgi:curved DNA-binding protein CbpA
MGNQSSKTQAYHAALLAAQQGQVDVSGLDPLEVLGIGKDFTWDELKEAFRQRAKLVHPDRGGSEALFNAVTECFRRLATEYKAREADRPHHELRADARAFSARQAEAPLSITAEDLKGDKFNETFNKLFDSNKLGDDEDFGYGGQMAASSKTRDDISVPQFMQATKAKGDKFAKEFNKVFEEATLPATNEVVRYAEPDALPMARQVQFTEIGAGRPGDFTRAATDGSGLPYSDYMAAYNNSRLVDPRAVQARREYRNVNDYTAARAARLEEGATTEELAYRAEREERERRREEERVRRAKERDNRHEQHFNQVSQLFLKR